MRLEQIETEHAKLTQAQIDEKLGQTIANVGKTVGRGAVQGGKAVANLAVKGAKASAPVIQKVAKQAGGALQRGAKVAGQQAVRVGRGIKQVGKDAVKTTGNIAKATGDIAQAAPDLAKAAMAQKAMQQRAAQGSRLAGGKSQTKFQQAVSRIGSGQGITGQLSAELAPHVKGLQAVLSDPMTRAKWKQLVAQAAKRVK